MAHFKAVIREVYISPTEIRYKGVMVRDDTNTEGLDFNSLGKTEC